MRFSILVAVGIATIGALGGPVRAGSIVAPNEVAAVEGNGANVFPFGTGSLPTQRYQQVYAASQFASLGGPVVVTQIAFRPDAPFGRAFSISIPDIQIDLSTTTAAPDALSTTFASNVGTDDTVVFPRGSLSLSSAFTGPDEGPKDFDIIINLVNPFRYDPTAGNLLLDVRRFSPAIEPGRDPDGPPLSIGFDLQRAAGDSVSRVFTTAAFPEGVDSPVGLAETGGLVTRFTVSAVPEPASVVLLGTGVLAMVGFGLRCRSRAGAKPAIPDIPGVS